MSGPDLPRMLVRESLGMQRARENLARAQRADAVLMRHIVLFRPKSMLARSDFQAYIAMRSRPTPMGALPDCVERDMGPHRSQGVRWTGD